MDTKPSKPILDYEARPARGLSRAAAIALVSGAIIVSGAVYVLRSIPTRRVMGMISQPGTTWTTGPSTAPAGSCGPAADE